ncbi:hypothetical protein L1887_17083 [Cichorium endivia]|nr:hypothetical protein L1887_17083 [Cichorium endivia]
MPIVKGFRRFQSNIVSFRQVVSEISSLVPGSNVQQCGWSSDAPSTPKRKRITSADRRALLEIYVNKYRGMNSGKFPTPTSAVKEVGGSYYSIKKMLQEMEYNFKSSSVKETKKETKAEDTVSKETVVESSTSQKVSNRRITMNQNLYEDAWLESAAANLNKNSQKMEGLEPSTSSEDTRNNNITRDDTGNIATESHDQCDEKPEHKFGFQDSESKVEQQHEHEHDGIRNINRDMPESQKDEEELKEKEASSSSSSSSSIWGNLKSLASGFINIWKKQ